MGRGRINHSQTTESILYAQNKWGLNHRYLTEWTGLQSQTPLSPGYSERPHCQTVELTPWGHRNNVLLASHNPLLNTLIWTRGEKRSIPLENQETLSGCSNQVISRADIISLSFLRSNIQCSFNISRKKQPYRSNIKSLVGRPLLVAVSVITAAKAEVTWSTIKNKKEAAVHVQCKTKSQKWSLISNNLVWPQTTMFFASPEDLYRTGWPKILNVHSWSSVVESYRLWNSTTFSSNVTLQC